MRVLGKTGWTREQEKAMEAGGCNLLVAAAAGAGKTAVLVERIIRKIISSENPVDIDRLLVVTFTNAAAAEMRERIADRIEKELDKNPGSRRLQRQLSLLSRASITTIHSFCLDVVKNHFHMVDLDPNFRVADATEALLLKQEALEELFEDVYDEENIDENFLKLVECYGGQRGDQKLQHMVLDLYDFTQSLPWPQKWLLEMAEDFNVDSNFDFSRSKWAKVLMNTARIEISGLLSIINDAVKIIEKNAQLTPYLDCFCEDARMLQSLMDISEGKWGDFITALCNAGFQKLKPCRCDDKKLQERVKKMRAEVRDRLAKITGALASYDGDRIIEDSRKLYPLIRRLSRLVMDFGAKYREKKAERGVIDFNDIEHYCLQILTTVDGDGNILPSRAALDLRKRFDEIMIDEYQDSNMVQEVILNIISRNSEGLPNMFMVGDVKQSIYRFRQAKPELFLEKYRSYSEGEGEKQRKILLYRNFRSRREIIDAVNFVFGQIMSLNVGELEYDGGEILKPGAAYETPEDSKYITGGPVEIHIIEKAPGEESLQVEDQDEPGDGGGESPALLLEPFEEPASLETEPKDSGMEAGEEPDAIQAEARIVAARIRELVDSDGEGGWYAVFDKKEGRFRPLRYGDIVILLRSTRDYAPVFMEELSAAGIPVYADLDTGYFDSVEVQTMISLLKIIDNPLQDIPLLSVLRSPIGGFSERELADIRIKGREGCFYEALEKFSSMGDDEMSCREDEIPWDGGESLRKTREKVRKFIDKLSGWRKRALYMNTGELIWHLYTQTGYYSFVGALPGGKERQANLRALFERAREYEKTSFKGLFNFINFIEKLKAGGQDMGSAKVLSEHDDVVRIMSVHKSKGLEFPVVILAGCGKKFNMQDMNRSVLFHQDLGFGPDVVDADRRITYPTVQKQAIKQKIRLETLSEEMRILYVALTRAREKLILTGTVDSVRKSVGKWAGALRVQGKKIPEYEILRGQNYLDWIGAALMRHGGLKDLRVLAQMEDDNFLPGGDSNPALIQDTSAWKVFFHRKKDVLGMEKEEMRERQDFEKMLRDMRGKIGASPYGEIIEKRLSWRYPYAASTRVPTKISVTELARMAGSETDAEDAAGIFLETLVKRPEFLESKKGLTAVEKGTAMHFVMRRLDLARVGSEGDIKAQVDEMAEDNLLSPEEAAAVDVGKIAEFFSMPLGKRMLASKNVRREVPFIITLDAREIYDLPEGYPEEKVVLQGVIDCYFEEEGGIVLIDYKTDRVYPERIDELKERYRMQVEYYARALEKITKMPVKEKYLCLFFAPPDSRLISY
ncbi:helicase-exonuclease AddAB subunit AddA [Thermoanaerobacterium sp. DL9XJH110]|uniref:helicase-exonuclease AddAB subunit AddA n=1 Tax=Thermoanaerobacterium sp. DL9XJH110 TaxID=3386643 RepID=UPI003BB628FA